MLTVVCKYHAGSVVLYRRDKQAGVLLARTEFDFILMSEFRRPPYTGVKTVHALTCLTVEVEEKSYQQLKTSSPHVLCTHFFLYYV